jgi:hypothetical protein
VYVEEIGDFLGRRVRRPDPRKTQSKANVSLQKPGGSAFVLTFVAHWLPLQLVVTLFLLHSAWSLRLAFFGVRVS